SLKTSIKTITYLSDIGCLEIQGASLMIDGCVARLRKYKPEEYELIIAHFVIGISLRTIAKKRRCSDGTIRKELQTAMGFISGVIITINPIMVVN
ncbi:antiterminator Q family protein, partial [Escherichia coli]|uniref:antiterminator Q family protein n=1 Tax=Escherichia coli TaxID=562 RepID=UPI001FCE64A7